MRSKRLYLLNNFQGANLFWFTGSTHSGFSSVFFTKLTPQKQREYLRNGIHIPQAIIGHIDYKENKDFIPSITITYDVNSEQYSSRTNNRLFIPLNMFREFNKLSNRKRTYDIHIQKSYQNSDTITIQIPVTYQAESTPEPINIKEVFGSFLSTPIQTGNTITLIQTLFMKAGEYPLSVYPTFTDFCKKVSDAYNAKMVLRRESD